MLVSNNFLRKVFGSLRSFLVKGGLSRVPRNAQWFSAVLCVLTSRIFPPWYFKIDSLGFLSSP